MAVGMAAAITVATAPVAGAADTAPASAAVFTHAADRSSRVVTLTFDADWWSPGDPDTVLRILSDNGITAGFGLTGRYAETFPDQTRKLLNAGHKLINHSYSHPYFAQLTQAQRWAELDRAEAAFNALGYTSGGWFRAPYRDGYLDPSVNRDLAARGYYINFDWTFDTTGYLGSSQDVILARVRQYTVPGAIIIMHLSTESTDTAALPAIISTLRGMGYGFTDPYRAVTFGAIRAKYIALGAQNSALGAPRTGEMVATTSGSSAVQWFQRGRIYWRADLGTYEVHGGIGIKYVALGTVGSFLGYPTTDETGTPDGIGRYNGFERGSIFWTAATDAHELHGGIRAKWVSLGSERGFLGYPTTDELAVPDGIGRNQAFQGGWSYWSPATDAHEVHGAIATKWGSLESARGLLGYPVTDEMAVTGGRASQFQGGNIYWSELTDAHEVHGGILGEYLRLRATAGALGLPRSDEYDITGGRRSDFEHGAIIWDAATGGLTVIYF
jgi:uncharacterized protein with LGFP repeats